MTKKKEIILNANGIAPCKHCLKKHGEYVYPKVLNIQGMFYTRCPNCTEEDPYEFLGLSEKNSLATWNRTMLNKGDFKVTDNEV